MRKRPEMLSPHEVSTRVRAHGLALDVREASGHDRRAPWRGSTLRPLHDSVQQRQLSQRVINGQFGVSPRHLSHGPQRIEVLLDSLWPRQQANRTFVDRGLLRPTASLSLIEGRDPWRT